MSEETPKATTGDTEDECDPVLTIHTGPHFPAPQAVVLPGGFDELHTIVSGLLADKRTLEADLQAVRAELATAQQALAGWAAQEAVRTGGNRRSPAERFIATARAWRPYLPYAQQARIIAGLIAEEEGEKP